MTDINGDSLSITKKSRVKCPRLSFKKIKEDVLGEKYSLSLVFIGDITSRKLNSVYKGKNKTAEILSFPLSKNCGEIFINLKRARDDAPKFGMSYRVFLTYLFIHGLLHLKGIQHGCTMSKEEKRLLKRYDS